MYVCASRWKKPLRTMCVCAFRQFCDFVWAVFLLGQQYSIFHFLDSYILCLASKRWQWHTLPLYLNVDSLAGTDWIQADHYFVGLCLQKKINFIITNKKTQYTNICPHHCLTSFFVLHISFNNIEKTTFYTPPHTHTLEPVLYAYA